VKFLCEHCKAKYQIADEKVAGRTVRMKCRKCGNSIEVRAAVTETSVSTRLSSDPPHTGYPAGGPEALPKPPRPAARTLATSFSSAQKPPAARQTGAPRSSDQGSLAGAFQRNVQTKEDEISVALDLRELSAADEWYVAINGVPVGPVRVAELRRKATIGVVTEESLCWQEGMEEWRPVRAVAELAALVREAAASGRVSLVTPPPPEVHPGSMSPSSRPASMRPVVGASVAAARPMAKPSGMPGAAARSNVVPFTARLATAERLQEEPKAVSAPSSMVAADPFASPPAVSPFRPPDSPFAPPTAPQPVAPQTFAPSPFAPSVAPSFVPAEPQKKAPPWILIAMFVLAAAFGITAAVLVFKPAPQVVVQVPSAAVPAAVAPTTGATATGANPPLAETAAMPAIDGGPVRVASGPRTNAASSGGKSASPVATDPALRDLIAGAGSGPNAGGPGESAGSGGGAQLTEDQVRSVLAMHTAGVKRTCWERVQTQSSSVNVTVHIVAGGSGQVTSATATGNDPVVAHCIETEVRRWTFPGSGAIDIPFHFLRQ
jgi:predicted Zn finger-like uncharacterized protein